MRLKHQEASKSAHPIDVRKSFQGTGDFLIFPASHFVVRQLKAGYANIITKENRMRLPKQ